MRKLIPLAAAAALLALPAAAAGHGRPTPPPKQIKAHDALVAKNSAWACKALRAQDAASFKKTFGTNANGRNAYGKCVSMHAHAKRSVAFRAKAPASGLPRTPAMRG